MDGGGGSFFDAGLGCEFGPAGDGLGALIEDGFGFSGFDAEGGRGFEEVVAGEAISFSVEAHLVLAGPKSVGIVAVGDIVGGGEVPLALLVHEKGDVFRMVVLVSR